MVRVTILIVIRITVTICSALTFLGETIISTAITYSDTQTILTTRTRTIPVATIACMLLIPINAATVAIGMTIIGLTKLVDFKKGLSVPRNRSG